MQSRANAGILAIAVTNDHVVVAVPGNEEFSGNFSGNVPKVMDTGLNKRTSKESMGYSWTSAGASNVVAYEYLGGIYDGQDLENVTITGKAVDRRNSNLPTISMPNLPKITF